MGPLPNIKDLPENFLVMNGDILTDLNYGEFYSYHVEKKSLFTISSKVRSQKIDYGVLKSDDSGVLKDFQEKPSMDYLVSMGIYMVNKNIIKYIPDSFYGFDSLMLDMLKKKEIVNIKKFYGYWLDIGRPDDYEKAIEDFESMRSNFL